MNGILLIDKPQGWTSFDAVNYVRKLVAGIEGRKPKIVKVGHTGTLDPLATGLLVLLVGKNYTRQATELSKQDKTYEVGMHLGQTSTTGDNEGIKHTVSSLEPSRQTAESVLQKFTGEIMQVPPAYSAMKVNGQRAYKLARAGLPVNLKARPITVYYSGLTDYTYPTASFVCRVSSGTYIRTLVEDIGKELGTGAYMNSLHRTSIGKFSVENAVSVKDVNSENIAKLLIN